MSCARVCKGAGNGGGMREVGGGVTLTAVRCECEVGWRRCLNGDAVLYHKILLLLLLLLYLIGGIFIDNYVLWRCVRGWLND